LKASGAKYEIVEIDLQNKPVWYQPKINPASKVPALSYGAPPDSDVSDPPAGTFLLPESGIITNFIGTLYPAIDYQNLITRAKAALAQTQFESLVLPSWSKFQRQGGKPEDRDAFISGFKAWSASIPDELLGEEYGIADALLAPFVTRIFLFLETDVGVWPEGTGPKTLEAIGGAEFSKVHKLGKKLQNWSAVKETIDQDALVTKFRGIFKKSWDENFAGKQ